MKDLTREELDVINEHIDANDDAAMDENYAMVDMQQDIPEDAFNCLTDGEAEETPTTKERLEIIDRQVEALLHENQMFTPMYPWVFVLVCQKEQQVGHIILPGKQNKTVHEGIVLATWRDKEVDRGITHVDGRKVTRHEILHSQMKLGDRVVFHHFAGQPVPGFDADRFRVVRELDWREDQQGGIFAKIEYAEDRTKPTAELIASFESWLASTQSECAQEDLEAARIALQDKIDDRFVVVDREAKSVTLSGR